MAKGNVDKPLAGPQLDARVAERVFGWKDIRRQAPHSDQYWGKKPDKLGRLRRAKVPSYSTDARLASQIEERMNELKIFDRYRKEVSKIARAEGLPADWASPEQRCRAALKSVANRSHLRMVKK